LVGFPDTLPEFYKYAVFVVFSVIIGQSFVKSTTVLIPFNRLFTYDGFENAFMLVLVYFFIITSWIGYFQSIIRKPHTETKIGTARFGTDLFILYVFYYILNLVDKGAHGDLFVWAFPLIRSQPPSCITFIGLPWSLTHSFRTKSASSVVLLLHHLLTTFLEQSSIA